MLVAAAVAMVLDWVAVARGDRRLEGVAKPAATALLAVHALLADGRSAWLVVALLLCLVGDVVLYLGRFVPGLVAFLLGHLAYVVVFWSGDLDSGRYVLGIALMIAVLAVVARPILVGTSPSLRWPVIAYMGVIGLMFGSALGDGDAAAVVGAALFVVSDTILAWNRFTRPLAWAPVAIMVTYHLAQLGLVVGLTGR